MAQSSKLTIVFIGSSQKEELLEKIISTAVRYERHIMYQDTHYLTYVVDGSEAIVELIDPGLEHTGTRQMSIRKAHGVILFYQASSQSSVNQLCDVAVDFQIIENKVKPAILLIGNENVDEKRSELASPLASQKYKSNSMHPLTVENAAKTKTKVDLNYCDKNVRIAKLQSQNVADLFGMHCKSLSITIPNYDGTLKFMEEMIRTIRLQQVQRRKSLLQAKVNSKICSIT